MSILLISLPFLAVIVTANLIAQHGGRSARLAFNLLLFLGNLLLAAFGLALPVLMASAAELTDVELGLFGSSVAGAAFVGMGVWGMVVTLRPVRDALARLMPALDAESPVHTLALVIVGYLMGNAAFSMAPGALEALAETAVEVSLFDVVAQQLAFALGAFAGVGLLVRRGSTALNQRLGLVRPTARQLWVGAGVIIFLVALQGCIGVLWFALQPEQAEQLSGFNQSLLGGFDTVGHWFVLAIASGLGEELLFRGALQPIFGIIPTSIIFAVSHVQYGLTPATLAILIFSITLGIIRKRSNTTVAIVVHAGYNFTLGLLSLLALFLQRFVESGV